MGGLDTCTDTKLSEREVAGPRNDFSRVVFACDKKPQKNQTGGLIRSPNLGLKTHNAAPAEYLGQAALVFTH